MENDGPWSLGSTSLSAAELLELLDDEEQSVLDFEIASPRDYDLDSVRVASLSTAGSCSTSSDMSVQSEPIGASMSTPSVLEPKRKSTFQRQKDEFAFLQSRISELEEQLQVLKATNQPKNGDHSIQRTALSLSMWRVVAKRQLEDRTRAERENAELKKSLKEQTLLAKSLERMLRKRPLLLKARQEVDARHAVNTHSANDSDVFQVLLHNIEERLRTADSIFAAQGLTSATTNVNSTRVVSSDEDDSQDVHVEVTRARVVPLNFRTLASTIWNQLGTKELKLDGIKLKIDVIKRTDEMLITKQSSLSSVNPKVSGLTTVFCVFKRVIEEDRVLMVREYFFERGGSPAQGTPTFYLSLHSCSQILRMDETGSCNSSSRPSRTSLIQLHVRLVPAQMQSSFDLSSNQPNVDPMMLIDSIIAAYQQNVESFLHAIQNALAEVVHPR